VSGFVEHAGDEPGACAPERELGRRQRGKDDRWPRAVEAGPQPQPAEDVRRQRRVAFVGDRDRGDRSSGRPGPGRARRGRRGRRLSLPARREQHKPAQRAHPGPTPPRPRVFPDAISASIPTSYRVRARETMVL